MPNTESLTLKDVQIKTPDGRNGVADFGRCSTKGGAGLDAANILISSHSLVIDDSTITLGSGGRGGDATVDNSCIATLAEGGDGGNPGNFLIESSSGIEIRNTLLITSGSGGDGGHANAIGIRASETTDGGSASAIAGSGNNLRVKPDPFNNVDNTDMIEISNVTGGNGGNASAVGGEGYIDQDCSTRNNSNGTAVAAFGTGGTITLSNEDTEPFFTIVNGADGIAVAEDGSFNNSTCIPANEAGSSTAPAQDTESPVL